MLKNLEKLITTIRERKNSSPDKSYTNKLLNDKNLSVAKVKEEIEELIDDLDIDDRIGLNFALAHIFENHENYDDQFRFLNEGLTPLAVAVNATPIVALAPIFNAWFGVTGSVSNQLVVATVVFFPVFINTAKGLTEVHVNEIELMRSYAAGDWTILKEVRIPNALPFFANALRVVAPLSVIAAIVAEYFGGPQDRVGYVITSNAGLARYDVAWAAIAVASAFGLSLFVGALLIERVSTPWKSAVQLEETTKK